ncbi:ATP-binding protein [Synechocystis sp. LKSZ1]|uniref:ATP-binding protein n=1 Tax=Synechocystis sp. LKSZ1 TaxID=3144951 RepID=UPI00336BB2B4
MNVPHTSEFSLLQVVQALEPQDTLLPLPSASLERLTQALLDSFRVQGLMATVWAKLPATAGFTQALEAYRQAGLVSQLYHCTVSKATDSFAVAESSNPDEVKAVVLEANSQLEREYFLLLLSPQLCVMVLAQASEDSLALLPETPLTLYLSCQPRLINAVLQALRQAVTITDQTPEELLADAVLSFPLPEQAAVAVMTTLLRHQLQGLLAPAPSVPAPRPDHSAFALLDTAIPFLVTVTREMSTPLTNMKTALRLLESMQHKREQRQRYIDLLKRECDRQNSLITGIQELIQIHQDPHPVGEQVRLEDCVPGVVSTYQPIAEEKGISLGYTIPADLPAVACSASALRSILQHLLHNSLKFTPEQGKVYVRASCQGPQVEIVVSDTGVGIEMSDLPKLFNGFYRGRNALSHLPGAGLGLTIVKQLVERWGGLITVKSHPHRGSHFHLYLPIAHP